MPGDVTPALRWLNKQLVMPEPDAPRSKPGILYNKLTCLYSNRRMVNNIMQALSTSPMPKPMADRHLWFLSLILMKFAEQAPSRVPISYNLHDFFQKSIAFIPSKNFTVTQTTISFVCMKLIIGQLVFFPKRFPIIVFGWQRGKYAYWLMEVCQVLEPTWYSLWALVTRLPIGVNLCSIVVCNFVVDGGSGKLDWFGWGQTFKEGFTGFEDERVKHRG
jgi:hypothetical protein